MTELVPQKQFVRQLTPLKAPEIAQQAALLKVLKVIE